MRAFALRLLTWALIACLVALVALVSIQVVYRQLGLSGSFGWTEEVSRGLFVWLVMLGAALGVAEGRHFAIGAIARKLPKPAYQATRAMSFICVLTIAAIFLIEGVEFALRGANRVSLVTGLPLAWSFAAVPVAGALMCVFLVPTGRPKNAPNADF